jgi:hypothetical protein
LAPCCGLTTALSFTSAFQERQELENRERQKELKYGAESVISLVLPVSVCMVVVILTIRSVSFYTTHDTQLV